MPSPGLSVVEDKFLVSVDKIGSDGNQKWKVTVDKPGVYYLSLLHTRKFSTDTLSAPEIIRFETEDDDSRWLQFDNCGVLTELLRINVKTLVRFVYDSNSVVREHTNSGMTRSYTIRREKGRYPTNFIRFMISMVTIWVHHMVVSLTREME